MASTLIICPDALHNQVAMDHATIVPMIAHTPNQVLDCYVHVRSTLDDPPTVIVVDVR